MQKSVTTKIKTGLDLFFFLAGLSHVATLFFLAKTLLNGHTPTDCHIWHNFYFLAGVTCGNFCAEHTLSLFFFLSLFLFRGVATRHRAVTRWLTTTQLILVRDTGPTA